MMRITSCNEETTREQATKPRRATQRPWWLKRTQGIFHAFAKVTAKVTPRETA